MSYKAETLEPIVVQEEKKLETPTFFKKDIEKIVKETVAYKNFDEFLDSYPDSTNVLNFDGEEHELTPEIEEFIIKCVEKGKMRYNNYYNVLNFFCLHYNTKNLESICFGCMNINTGADHSGSGYHIEIFIDKENDIPVYTANASEL